MSGTSTPFGLSPGLAPLRITVDGNSPAGSSLVNLGTNGGTIWVQPGPTASAGALPIGPGGSLRWTDPVALPYAFLAAGSTSAETLVVTDQSADYSNPAAVAAATATKLAAQGIPSTFLDGGVYAAVPASGASTTALAVGGYASLIVSVYWPQPTPLGPCALRLSFTDPAVPSLSAIQMFCTNDNSAEAGLSTWVVPVLAPTLTITNLTNSTSAAADISVVGNNRTVPAFRQLGAEVGIKQIQNLATVLATTYPLNGWGSTSRMTRYNGHVQLSTATQGVAGTITASWVDETVTVRTVSIFTGTAGNELYDFAHPSVPVYWTYTPKAASPGNGMTLTVIQKS